MWRNPCLVFVSPVRQDLLPSSLRRSRVYGKPLGLPTQHTNREQVFEEIDIQSHHMWRARNIVVGDENRITVRRTFR